MWAMMSCGARENVLVFIFWTRAGWGADTVPGAIPVVEAPAVECANRGLYPQSKHCFIMFGWPLGDM